MSTISFSASHASQNERYQRDLQLAVRSGWLAYVFAGNWLYLALPAWILGALLDSFFRVGVNLPAVWHLLRANGFLTWGMGFFFGFQILFRSIDRAGKRKVARLQGLLPSSPCA